MGRHQKLWSIRWLWMKPGLPATLSTYWSMSKATIIGLFSEFQIASGHSSKCTQTQIGWCTGLNSGQIAQQEAGKDGEQVE